MKNGTPSALVYDEKCVEHTITIRAVVGRRRCKEIIESDDYRFEKQILWKFLENADGQVCWTQEMTDCDRTRFNVDDVQLKIVEEGARRKTYWLFEEELENCENLINEFEENFKRQDQKWQLKRAREKEEDERMDEVVVNIRKKERSKMSFDSDNNRYPPHKAKKEKDFRREFDEKLLSKQSCVDKEEELQYLLPPSKKFIRKLAFQIFKEFEAKKAAAVTGNTITKKTSEQLRAYYKAEWKAIFVVKAKTEFKRRAAMIKKRRTIEAKNDAKLETHIDSIITDQVGETSRSCASNAKLISCIDSSVSVLYATQFVGCSNKKCPCEQFATSLLILSYNDDEIEEDEEQKWRSFTIYRNGGQTISVSVVGVNEFLHVELKDGNGDKCTIVIDPRNVQEVTFIWPDHIPFYLQNFTKRHTFDASKKGVFTVNF